jgi:hypothetical protein
MNDQRDSEVEAPNLSGFFIFHFVIRSHYSGKEYRKQENVSGESRKQALDRLISELGNKRQFVFVKAGAYSLVFRRTSPSVPESLRLDLGPIFHQTNSEPSQASTKIFVDCAKESVLVRNQLFSSRNFSAAAFTKASRQNATMTTI